MIGVTGANGYVGGRVLSHLRAAGAEAVALVRDPEAYERSSSGVRPARCYALAEPLGAATLDGIETVIHAAWDLSSRGARVREVNVRGSLPLLDGLAARGGRAVVISSLAAFAGARSDYGQAKLELERLVLERRGVALRPGLIFGVNAGGLFGALTAAASTARLTPLIGGGRQRLFVTHDERLCELIATIVEGRFTPVHPVFAAHELPTTLRAIVLQLVATHDRRPRVIPISGRFAYLVLRAVETTGVSLPFRSDSVLSLMNPAPLDQVAALERTPVEFPPLTPELWQPARGGPDQREEPAYLPS